MLQSERMSKLIITAQKSYLEKTIQELYRLNAVHIVNHSANEQTPAVLDIGTPLESASKISETLIAVKALISNLELKNGVELKNGFKAVGVKNFAQLARTVRQLQEETNSKLEKIKQLESEVKALEDRKKPLVKLSKLELPLEVYSGYSSMAVFIGQVTDANILERDISKETDEFQLHSAEEGSQHIIALFVSAHFKERIREILASNNFSELDMSSIAGMKGSASDFLSGISAKHERLIKSISDTKKQLHRLSEKWHDFLLLSEKLLSIELEKAEAPLRFAASESIFVVSGWIPSKNTPILTERIQKITKGNVEIEFSKPSHDDDVPVKLSNSRQVKPFEFFMNLYALPKYWEVDPTVFLFITFPLFFGIILGDVGYGVTIALMLLYISKKFPSAASLAKVMMPAALSSIFFGFLFGEIFGFEEFFGYSLPHVISRLHQIKQMLVVSVAIGLIHVNIGIMLGFINELNNHGIKKAILAKGSWWVLQLGIAAAALSSTNMVAIPMYAAGLLVVAAIAMLILGEPMEIVEIPAIFSNMLSYSRLMAVGLASVGLAVVVNRFIEEFLSAGGIMMIIAAILVGTLGHLLNIALGLLGGFLHSIRLHYVEFFTKFFKGGAIPFKAFGRKIEEVAET